MQVFRRPNDYAALVPSSIRATLQSPHSNLRHLVIVRPSLPSLLRVDDRPSSAQVPGHAIWTGCDATHATQDTDWILEPMQRGGSVKTYLKHIIKGCASRSRCSHAHRL